MPFFNDNTLKDIFNHTHEVPGLYQRPQSFTGAASPSAANSTEVNQNMREPLNSEEPVKEIRTYMRDGTDITEEYERLNPDGTVTKTVSIGNKKDGLKHFGVYKMDKSGIVRRIDNVNPKELIQNGVNESHNKYIYQNDLRHKTRNLGNISNNEGLKNAENINQEPFISIKNNQRVINYSNSNEKSDQYLRQDELGHQMQQKRQLSPDEKFANFKKYKETLINYGTKKLEKILTKRFSDDKINDRYKLTNDQKEKLINYGVKKLQRLIEKNLHLENIPNISEDSEDFSKMGSESKENEIHNSSYPSNSFVLQPKNEITSTEKPIKNSAKQRPVSFFIRPENGVRPQPQSTPSKNKQDAIYDRYKSLWKKFLNEDMTNTDSEYIESPLENKYRKKVEDKRLEDDEKPILRKNQKYENANLEKGMHKILKNPNKKVKKYDSEDYLLDALDGLENEYKRIQSKERSQKKLEKYPSKEEDWSVSDRLIKLHKDLKESTTEEHNNGICDKFIYDVFGEDEIFDYGLKKLRKYFKKTLSDNELMDVDEQLQRKKLDPRNRAVSSTHHEQQYEDTNKNLEQNSKSSSFNRLKGIPFQLQPLTNVKPSSMNNYLEEEKQYMDSLNPSSSQLQEDKISKQRTDSKPLNNGKKLFDFNSLLSMFDDSVSTNDSVAKQVSSNRSEQNPNKAYNQTQSHSKINTEDESSQESFWNPIDLKSILSKINKTISNDQNFGNLSQKNGKTIDTSYRLYKPRLQTNKQNNESYVSAKETEVKPVDMNSLLSTNEKSNFKRSSFEDDLPQRNLKYNISSPLHQNQQNIKTTSKVIDSAVQREDQFNNPVSFQLRPKTFNGEPGRHLENHQIDNHKSNSTFGVPWWFDQSGSDMFNSHLMKDPGLLNPLESGLLENDSANDSFFSMPHIGNHSLSNPLLGNN